MNQHIPGGFAQYVRGLAGFLRTDPRSDSELLAAFAAGGDHAAFTALVARHGPAVWATCRGKLGDGTDAEDGFQAVFIALSRKAGTVRPETLAGWLARVARDVTLKIERTARRRDAAHQRLYARVANDDPNPPSEEELRAVVREEMVQLPERLRSTLSLYYLEGKTQPEVGRILGITTQAVSKRLRSGLEGLRERLARRGFAVTAGALAAVIGGVPVAKAMPADLIEATAEAARVASTACRPTTAAERIAMEVVRAGDAVRLKHFGLLLFAAVGTVGGSIFAFQAGRAEGPSLPTIPPLVDQLVLAPVPDAEPSSFKDPLPEGAIARLGTIRYWSENRVVDAARSADGKTLITADGKGDLSFWSAEGLVASRLEGPGQSRWVALSPDGRRLVAAGKSDVWLWDLEPAGPRRRWKWNADTSGAERHVQYEFTSLAFSPDGKIVAFGDGWSGSTQLLHAGTGELIRALEGAAWPPLCFTADSKTLAAPIWIPKSIKRTQVNVWEVQTGRQKTLDSPEGEAVRDIDLSPDGKRLAWAADDSTVRIWEPSTGKEVTSWPAHSPSTLLAFAPDGRTVAEFAWGQILYRDAATGKESQRSNAIPNAWFAMTGRQGAKRLTADRTHLVLAGAGILATFEIATGREIGPIGRFYDPPRSLAFTADGKRLVSLGGWGDVRSWDAATGRSEKSLAFRGSTAVVDARGSGADGCVQVVHTHPPDEKWEWNKSAVWLSSWDGKAATATETELSPIAKGALAVSPDGRYLARLNGAEIVVSEPGGKELRRVKSAANQEISDLIFSGDGRTLLSYAPQNGAVEAWDPETGRARCEVVPEFPGCVGTPLLSADGRWIAVSRQVPNAVPPIPGRPAPAPPKYEIVVCELSTGKQSQQIEVTDGFPGPVALSADGRMLSFGCEDGTVVVWDLKEGREVRRFHGHRAGVRSLAFSPDGRRLASGSIDCTGLVWDVSELAKPSRK